MAGPGRQGVANKGGAVAADEILIPPSSGRGAGETAGGQPPCPDCDWPQGDDRRRHPPPGSILTGVGCDRIVFRDEGKMLSLTARNTHTWAQKNASRLPFPVRSEHVLAMLPDLSTCHEWSRAVECSADASIRVDGKDCEVYLFRQDGSFSVRRYRARRPPVRAAHRARGRVRGRRGGRQPARRSATTRTAGSGSEADPEPPSGVVGGPLRGPSAHPRPTRPSRTPSTDTRAQNRPAGVPGPPLVAWHQSRRTRDARGIPSRTPARPWPGTRSSIPGEFRLPARTDGDAL